MLLILISILVWRVSPDMSASIDWRIDCIALASLRSSLWMLHMSLISCLLRLKWVYILYLWCPFRCRDSETSYDHTMRRNIRWSGFATMTVFPVSCHKVVGQAWLCPEWRMNQSVGETLVLSTNSDMVFSLLYTYLQKWNSFYMYSTYTYLEHDIDDDVSK